MQSNHFTSHDLDLLESYIFECIQQLPKLPSAADAANTDASPQIPTRCALYHTVCSNLLKEVVSLVSLSSPRLSRLIGQVWELASLNVFVLLQVANTALQKTHRLHDQLVLQNRFHAESLQHQTVLMQRDEEEIARQQVNAQKLRAELQTARRQANRLAVENGQLHLAVRRVSTAQDIMGAARVDGVDSPFIRKSDDSSVCEDSAVVEDVMEHDAYGIGNGNDDALVCIKTIHPIESFSIDFEHLFQALFEGEERSVSILNQMDRFMNSSAVSLLWRYGSAEEEHQMMYRMLRASTVSTQTDGALLERLFYSAQTGDNWKRESKDYDSSGSHSCVSICHQKQPDKDETLMQEKANGHKVMETTKYQTMPATLRAQFDSRPQVRHVLEKAHLNRILLRLYLEKLECDAQTLRQQRVPSARIGAVPDKGVESIAIVRTPLHGFMKQFFLARYEIPSLAEFHMMEVVKSCIYYYEQLQSTLHRDAARASTALLGCLPKVPDKNNQHAQATRRIRPISELLPQPQQFVAADVRIALFSRLCDLVPFALEHPTVDTKAGDETRSACLLNAVIDMLGDVLELDPSVSSLAAVEEILTEENWGLPRDLASELLTQYFSFVDYDIVEDSNAFLARLAPVSKSDLIDATSIDCIAVDVFLALFAITWIKFDQRLESKVRNSFRHRLLMSSPFAKTQSTDAQATADDTRDEYGQPLQCDSGSIEERLDSRVKTRRSLVKDKSTAVAMQFVPLTLLTKIWSSLENEKLSPLDVEELVNTFQRLFEAKLLDTKLCQPQSLHTRCKEVSEATMTVLPLAGVTENEFVFHTLQVLRRRRNNHGLRTNSRRPPHFAKFQSQFHESLDGFDQIAIPLSSLKPGLASESFADITK